jgi:hypothetical protein
MFTFYDVRIYSKKIITGTQCEYEKRVLCSKTVIETPCLPLRHYSGYPFQMVLKILDCLQYLR